LLNALFLVVDAEQIVQSDTLKIWNRMQRTLLMIPAEGGGNLPIRCLRLRAGQYDLKPGKQAFGTGEELVEFIHFAKPFLSADFAD